MNVEKLRKLVQQDRICWGLLLLMVAFCTVCFCYGDQPANISQSVFFMESILKGNFGQAYQDYIEIIGSDIPHGANFPLVYEPMAYFVMSIFSIPLIIIHRLVGLNFQSPWFNLYVKMQTLMIILMTAYIIYLICKELYMDNEHIKIAIFTYLSSFITLYFSIVIGQVETFGALFSLLGILYWLRGNTFKFILFFSIAIPIKMFALLIFVPLILIREKSILKIIFHFLGGVSLYILEKIIFGLNSAYRISTLDPNQRMIETMTSKMLPGGLAGIDGIPIFIFIYILICICLYVRTEEDIKIMGIYYSFAIYSLLFIFVGHYPYWIIILSPLLPIMLAYNDETLSINLLLDLFLGISYIFSSIIYHGWTSHVSTVDNMFLPSIFGKHSITDIKYPMGINFLNNWNIERFGSVFIAIYTALLVSLIILNWPHNNKFKIAQIHISKNIVQIFRVLSTLPFLALMIFCYYCKKPEVLITTISENHYEASWNLFSEEAYEYGRDTIVQEIYFPQDAALDNLQLMFTREGNTYSAAGSLYVSLKEKETNKTLVTQRLGYNELAWGKCTTIKLNGVNVKMGQPYIVEIYPDKCQMQYAFINVTEGNPLGTSLRYLGQETGCSLYFQVEGKAGES